MSNGGWDHRMYIGFTLSVRSNHSPVTFDPILLIKHLVIWKRQERGSILAVLHHNQEPILWRYLSADEIFVYTLIRREDFPRCRFGGNYLKYLTQYSMLRYHLYTRIRKKVWWIHHVHSLIKLNAENSRNDGVFFLRRSGFGRTDFRIRRDVAVSSSNIRRDVQKWSGRTQIFGGKPSECTHSAFNVVFHLYACTQHCANSQRVFF